MSLIHVLYLAGLVSLVFCVTAPVLVALSLHNDGAFCKDQGYDTIGPDWRDTVHGNRYVECCLEAPGKDDCTWVKRVE